MSAINEKYIRGPFRHDGHGYIFGPDNFMFATVATVRGWGELKYVKNGAEIQDANQEHMVRALNAHFPMLEALQDLTAQIMADWQADCTELLPESAEFKAALVAIAKAEGES